MVYFLLPVFIYAVLSVYLDPFNYFRAETNERLNKLKLGISFQLNFPLYKLIEYQRSPSRIILLGDSRTGSIGEELFERVRKEKTSNLAYGGGTLVEIIDTFNYITKTHQLDEVYIGINFNLYNEHNNSNRVSEAIEIRKTFVTYLFNTYTAKSLYLILKALILEQDIHIGKPLVGKEEFWRRQIDRAKDFFVDYTHPTGFYSQLTEISKYCKQNGIKLTFFIPPTHTDLQGVTDKLNLKKEEQRFKDDLSRLGNVYDFNFPNLLTRNKANFNDPFHFTQDVGVLITEEIISQNLKYSRNIGTSILSSP